ncbi:hypothetical protein [Anaeromyxobacter oryzae]|uniref:Uncharacterized protein n=1 Tax=Anaeromyxobacter oryzae TaxID=2918170 RepID=A0ABM7X2E7_9BACT|nr:hypothetical protein [Anaeromyxobacter oryzae]BDG05969.1 hypothetical protein AMOR_49650 [Anaeromyxobacter oryzae]
MGHADRLLMRVVLEDADLIGLEVSFSSHGWQAATMAYTQIDSLSAFAERLRVFAAAFRGDAIFEAGADDARELGFVRMRFSAADARGHIACTLTLKTGPERIVPVEAGARVSIELQTETALLDQFLGELERLVRRREDAALLLT